MQRHHPSAALVCRATKIKPTQDETLVCLGTGCLVVFWARSSQLRCSVCARDLKLDNTLLDSNRPQRIKLCDFGFAKAWEAGSKNMFTHIG